MKEYLEKTLRQSVELEEDIELLSKLPLVFKGRYIAYKVKTNGALWTAIQPKNDAGCKEKAGITTLCEYSLLSDNPYPTYAVTKKEIADLGIKAAKQVKLTDDVRCVVLELGYFIDFDKKGTRDHRNVP